jgi:catechol 2,3-dioxygenase-like lactoylglutathione lyase family enzyme
MFNHIMVGASDNEKSKTFYDAVLATLGAGERARLPAASDHRHVIVTHLPVDAPIA